MCGISGILTNDPGSLDLQGVIRVMSQRMRHRGPDDEGFVFFNKDEYCCRGSEDTQPSAWNAPFLYAPRKEADALPFLPTLAMGHRRLSVIDLSEAGHQPMCSDDGMVWVSCNGEIYNYIELRAELEQQGVVFKTRSDIEVLLQAYLQWGYRCLDRFNGMWAFVICDRREQILFGARDRFGVKPLYYYHRDFFAFASEQKALLAIPGIITGISAESVYEHLLLGRVEMREEGHFTNIRELRPGHFFEYNLATGQFNTRSYYHLSFFRDYRPFDETTFRSYLPEVREKMQRAVELRLRSDVPVGFCLSGGLDSSSIVCLSASLPRSSGTELHTFTATNGHQSCDESHWARMVNEATSAVPHEAVCRAEDILPAISDMVWHQDVPLYSTSTFAQNMVMKCARENGCVILLDGQGGDELFAGYQTFVTSHLLELIRKSPLRRFPAELSSMKNSPSTTGIFFRSLLKIWLDNHLSDASRDRMAARYRPELAYFTKQSRHAHAGLLSLAGEFSSKTVNELLHHYFTGYYLKNLLRWEDRCSMQYSIESRTPFADDQELIELIFSIPSSFKIRKGFTKALQREAMTGILPEAVRLRRDKLGFATPQSAWLTRINPGMKELIADLQSHDDLGMVDYQLLMKDWDRIFSDPSLGKSRDFVFRLLNYLIWRERFGI
jgi:asparagine synthase (glutamine-hydrolysing)